MAEHRTNCVRLPILELTKFSASAQGELKFDFSDFDKVVLLFIEEGVIGRIEGGHIGWRSGGWTSQWLIEIRKINNGAVESARVDPSSQDADKFYGQFLPALVSHLKEKGWLDIYIQHQADECVPENSQSYKAIGTLVHKYAPELSRIDAVLLREEVVGAVDIWVPRVDHIHQDYDFFKERQRLGEEVWFYTAVWPQGEWANRFVELPLLRTRILHWMNYRYGITGYLHWGYNYWKFNGITDPFTQTTPPHGASHLPAGDAWIVYPGPGKKPFDSMRHEAMRDGIADYELLSMLNERDSTKARALAARHVIDFDEYDCDVKRFRATRLELLTLLQETATVNFSTQAAKDFDVSVTPSNEDGRFVVLPVENPRYRGNELFRGFENYYSPRVRELRNRYGLDAVVAGETDEWKRILLLRHWIKSNIAIDNNNPTQTRGDTFAILDAALKGGKFHCTHFSIVQHAVLNSFGYVTRRLGCGPGLKEDGGHHGVNEVWVNKFGKWVLIDAKYNAHFEKSGVALSALEIRDEVWRDGAQSVICVVGPDRRPMKPDSETGKSETRPDTYRWCSWETSTNRFTTFPARSTSTLIMLGDEIFKKNTWYRDGKPHWAYDTPYMILTTRRDWIEWTPNVINSKVAVKAGKARVFLSSCTPNFRGFQIKASDDTWRDCGEEVELPLAKEGRNRFTFRTINLFGVAGPEHRVEIVYSLDGSEPIAPGTLFSESFDDPNVVKRGWYDGTKIRMSDKDACAGAGCIEYAWEDGGKAAGSRGLRHLFEPTEVVYIRFYMKLSEGWEWSGRSYHPHMLHFLTTENSKYHGPARSHLTLYIEANGGRLRLGATDMQNASAPHGLTQGPLRGGYNGKLYDSKEALLDDADWHCIEAMFKLNSVDVDNDKWDANGQLRAWFDGKLVIERTDIIFRTADFPGMKINQFLLAPYFGPGLLPHAQTLWIDELAVGTKRVGPVSPLDSSAASATFSGFTQNTPGRVRNDIDDIIVSTKYISLRSVLLAQAPEGEAANTKPERPNEPNVCFFWDCEEQADGIILPNPKGKAPEYLNPKLPIEERIAEPGIFRVMIGDFVEEFEVVAEAVQRR